VSGGSSVDSVSILDNGGGLEAAVPAASRCVTSSVTSTPAGACCEEEGGCQISWADDTLVVVVVLAVSVTSSRPNVNVNVRESTSCRTSTWCTKVNGRV